MRRFRVSLCTLGTLLLVFFLPVAALLPREVQQPIQCRRVLTVEDVTNLLEVGVPEARVKNFVTTCKVTFKLSKEQEKKFRGLGASSDVVLAMVLNYQKPAPPPKPEEARVCTQPLSESDLTELLQAGVVDQRLQQLVNTCGVAFQSGPEQAKRFQALGASSDLNLAIIRNYRAPDPPTVTLRAGRTKIEKGESVTLTWSSANTEEITLEPGIGRVEARGLRKVKPEKTTTYQISARGPGGKITKSLTVTVIDLGPEYVLERTLTGHSYWVRSVAFSPIGKLLASGDSDGTIKLWDVSTGRLLRTLTGHKYTVTSVAFSPDGQVLASGGWDKTIKLWNPSTGKKLRALKGHSLVVSSVAFSPDGKLLASASKDKTIKLWDPATGRELRTLKGHREPVVSVAFRPDGKLLASGSNDKTIKLWDVSSGRELRILKGHGRGVWSVAFSPDGQVLASSGGDKTIKLWNVSSGQELRILKGHGREVRSVAFSSGGKTLASGSYDDTIKLWNVSSGRELRTLKGHKESVSSVAFSPDGKLLASGSNDGIIHLWRRVKE